ncbi:hypothetical protein BDZ45DRAFT_745227 [Acephala macrosclerotiorum]|nr:hypothetical protein BDZ45DRAFT_745227 [Acephala macrosclerotiorum]
MDRVESKDGKLNLYDDRPKDLTRVDLIVRFPTWFFNKDTSNIQAALISSRKFEKLLLRLKIVSFRSSLSTAREMKSKSKTSISIEFENLFAARRYHALDLADAQFGYIQPIMPRDEYVQSRVQNPEAMKSHSHGHTRNKLAKAGSRKDANSILTMINGIVQEELKSGMVQ